MLSVRHKNEEKMKPNEKKKDALKKELKFRNRKPTGEKRTARLTVSLKPKEKAALATTAKKYNMTMGDLAYYLILNRPIRVRVPEHTEALRLIATMSNNMNQIARDANASVLFKQILPDSTVKALNDCLARLDELLTKTM